MGNPTTYNFVGRPPGREGVNWLHWQMVYAAEQPASLKRWCKDKPFTYQAAKNHIKKADLPIYEKALERRLRMEEFRAKGNHLNPIKDIKAFIEVFTDLFIEIHKDTVDGKSANDLITADSRGNDTIDPRFDLLMQVTNQVKDMHKLLNVHASSLYTPEKLREVAVELVKIVAPHIPAEEKEKAQSLLEAISAPLDGVWGS